jgi:hypothetical protein
MGRFPLAPGVASSLLLVCLQAQPVGATGGDEFTAAQSAEGKVADERSCRQSHGRDLDDGDFGPPLRGTAFMRNWGGKAVAELFTYIPTRMPSDAPGSLGARAYTGVLAYILQSNDFTEDRAKWLRPRKAS